MELDLSTLIFIATLGIFILIFFIILFVFMHHKKMRIQETRLSESGNSYQKLLLNAAVEIAENERARIAANIHDDIGMMLNVLKLNLHKANRNINDQQLTREILINANKTIEDVIESIRIISNDLMPPTLVKLGFVKAIIEMCDQINATDIVKVNLDILSKEIKLDKKSEIQLYRINKEILNNIIKHTNASSIEISIRVMGKSLTIIIYHNGEGITTENVKRLSESSRGIGLKSILARVQLLNAFIYYDVQNERSKISIETPLL